MKRSVVWWAVLAVAACGVVATAHGEYEVARVCGVDWRLAGLYPAMAAGLALCAYTATTRLSERVERLYAWTVVVVTAGASGVAQGAILVGLGVPTPGLRFGVGAAPAVAGMAAAHLLWLVRRPADERVNEQPAEQQTERPDERPSERPNERPAERAGERPGLHLVSGQRARRRADGKVKCEHCNKWVGESTRRTHLRDQRRAADVR